MEAADARAPRRRWLAALGARPAPAARGRRRVRRLAAATASSTWSGGTRRRPTSSTSAGSSSARARSASRCANPQRGRPDDRLRHRRRRDRARSRSTGRRRSAGSARARSSCRSTGSRTTRSRSASRARRGSRRCTRSPAAVATPAAERPRLPRLRADRAARRRRPRRARAPLAAVAAAGRPAVAGGVHGADRRAPHLPRRRGALRGVRAPGGAAGGARRCRASSCSGVALSALGMTFVSAAPLARARGARRASRSRSLVAIGIGVHNLGEGLAIGTSFATGELQLGAFLVIGFMVHNVTEGLGIAAPASRERVASRAARRCSRWSPARRRSSAPGSAATPRTTSRRVFFALAAGAALQVVVEVGRYVARTRAGRAPLRLGDRRLPRGDRRDVGHRAPHRIERLLVRPFLLAVLVAVLAVGCGPIPESSLPDLSAKDEIRVVTTVGMIADAVENVGGPRVRGRGADGPGVDPHLYKASEGDVRRLDERTSSSTAACTSRRRWATCSSRSASGG